MYDRVIEIDSADLISISIISHSPCTSVVVWYVVYVIGS